MSDRSDPKTFILSPEDMAEMRANGGKPSSQQQTRQPIKFYKFPREVVNGLVKADYRPAWPLVAAILETYCDDYRKRNPVRLTSKKAKEHGLSSWEKYQALKVLDGIDQFMMSDPTDKIPGFF
jgi:hypothetical protein